MKTSSDDNRLIQALPAKGIYTLIIFLPNEVCINVGKLGIHKFLRGHYTYTGSALGRGASSLKRRVSRHLWKRKMNLWHIDFLLTNGNATVTAVVVAETGKKLECDLNRYIKREGAKILVGGFGASDCKENCKSHLLFFPDIIKHENLVQKVIKCARLVSNQVFVVRL